MRKLTRQLSCAAATVVCLLSASAKAVDVDLDLYAALRGTARGGGRDLTILFEPDQFDETTGAYDTSRYLQPQAAEIYPSGFVALSLDAKLTSMWRAALMLSSGEIRQRDLSLTGTTTLTRRWTASGRPIEEEAAKSFFVREAYMEWHAPSSEWWSISVGRKLWRVGQSLIYDDWSVGAGVDLDFDAWQGKPWRVTAAWIAPARDWASIAWQSPLLSVRVDYALSFFEALSFGLAYFHDGSSEISELPRQALIERAVNLNPSRPLRQASLACFLGAPVESTGDLFYATLGGNKTIGPGMLRATAVLEWGNVSVFGSPVVRNNCEPTASTQVIALQSLGFSADVAYRWSVTERFAVTPWFFVASGQDGPESSTRRQNYSAFLGVLPFITRTNLFFAGGLNETFGSRTLTAAGVNGRGVISPGVSIQWNPRDDLRAKLTTTGLWSWAAGVPAPAGAGGRFYGIEVDTNITYEPLDWLGFGLEADVLAAGNFYAPDANGSSLPVWKVILSTDFQHVFHWFTRSEHEQEDTASL